ncbi:MAG: peptidylprolyl isomerase [Ruminococcus sp.]|nr:peptidylprolyl isomerase [Ruminococcus sp.]
MKNNTVRLLSLTLVVLMAGLLLLAGCGGNTTSGTAATTAPETTVAAEATTAMATADSGDTGLTSDKPVKAVIDVKDYGVITLELYPNIAPKTVENFVKLAKSGFYDGLTFHRIMNGFMIQGGDPKGNGTGGSDENIVGEFEANGFKNDLSHTRGVISMARAQDMNSASSQFFIVHQDSTFLDGQYAAFGAVTDGMNVVDKIATDAKPVDDNGTIPSDKQPIIISITIPEE